MSRKQLAKIEAAPRQEVFRDVSHANRGWRKTSAAKVALDLQKVAISDAGLARRIMTAGTHHSSSEMAERLEDFGHRMNMAAFKPGLSARAKAKRLGAGEMARLEADWRQLATKFFPTGVTKKSSVVKTALDLQKMKKNMDDAPARPDKIQIMSKEDMKKSASVMKNAMGVMPLVFGAMAAPTAVRQAKTNLRGMQGTGGQILTPEQMSQRGLQMGAR